MIWIANAAEVWLAIRELNDIVGRYGVCIDNG